MTEDCHGKSNADQTQGCTTLVCCILEHYSWNHGSLKTPENVWHSISVKNHAHMIYVYDMSQERQRRPQIHNKVKCTSFLSEK